MDYKEELIKQILGDSVGLFTQTQQEELMQILTTKLYKYEIFPKEEYKELPATVIDFNFELLNRYLLAKTVEGKSPKTVSQYKTIINKFLLNLNKKISDINTDDVRFYLALLKTKDKNSNTSIENNRVILNGFFNFLADSDYINKNPMKSIKPVKKDTIKEKPFTTVELELLRNSCKNERDRAIIEFLLATGCRVAETVSVNRDQIDFFSKEFRVIGKGDKDRTILINDKALLYIKKYLDTRMDDNPALFAHKVKPFGRLSTAGIEDILKDIAKDAQVLNVHPHRFRKTFCCNNIDGGMSIEQVAELMGHESIDTTMNSYYTINKKRLSSDYDRINNL